jgi:hypothetical protein
MGMTMNFCLVRRMHMFMAAMLSGMLMGMHMGACSCRWTTSSWWCSWLLFPVGMPGGMLMMQVFMFMFVAVRMGMLMRM